MRIATIKTIVLALVLGAVIEGCVIVLRFVPFEDMDFVVVLLHVPAVCVMSVLLSPSNVTHVDSLRYVAICQAVIWTVVAYLFLLWAKWKQGLKPRPR